MSILDLSPLEATRVLRDISVTERGTFRQCRRRWNLATIENLQPKQYDDTALPFGSGMHGALEAYYMGRRDRVAAQSVLDLYIAQKLTDANGQDEYTLWNDLGEMADKMLEHYFKFDEVSPVQFGDILSVEGTVLQEEAFFNKVPEGYPPDAEVIIHPSGRIMCPIVHPDTKAVVLKDGEPVYLTARIDLLTTRRTPKLGYWIVDHKTAASAPSDKGLDFDDQATGYCYVVYRWLAILVRGIIWNVLIKNTPEEPRIVQDRRKGMKGLETLSTAKDQQTLPSMYREALKDWGFITNGVINSEDHEKCLAALLARGWDPFYKRYELIRNEHELASFEYRLYNEYIDMSESLAAGEDKLYPNPSSRHCPGCPVNRLCLAIEDGSDWEDVLEHGFVVGPDRKAVRT